MKSKKLTFKEAPFSRLVEEVKELSSIRQEYAKKTKKQRERAAEYQYNDAYSSMLFNELIGEKPDRNQPWFGEMIALAIDPDYAPALLTVGSYEYLYNRKDESMIHFLKLTELPEDTEDLTEIIDKAGDFLIGKDDISRALILYGTAAKNDPDNHVYHNSLSYCYGKAGNHIKAVEEASIAISLDPDNYVLLTDAGWTMVEAGLYDEALPLLEKAVRIAPPEYKLAGANLDELLKRKKRLEAVNKRNGTNARKHGGKNKDS